MSISATSQNLSSIQTQFRKIDTTLLMKTFKFDLTRPIKVRFNDSNAVLISETHMDSINLKYLGYILLYSKNKALNIDFKRMSIELEKADLRVTFLTGDNGSLKLINDKLNERIEIKDKIYDNDMLLWKAKAKGKIKIFLLGAALGIIIAFLGL